MSGSATIGSTERPLRVAVVGSGPAGFFAAHALLRQQDVKVELDLLERLPTPYGLVRGGVAPDHQTIKSVTRVYERIATQPGFRFLGNVLVGRDLRVQELQQHYDQVVYAVGNEANRRLGIPGEGLLNCAPATVFVGWYNGHPDYRGARLDLSVQRAAVVGNGNVAIDVARILAQDPAALAPTDIADYALHALQHSGIREIVLLGRRGPAQASFTPAELRELGALPGVAPVVDPADLQLDPHSAAELQHDPRAQRNLALLEGFAARPVGDARRRIVFRFLVSPVELLGDEQESVRAVRLRRNRIELSSGGRLHARGTDELEDLPAQLVLPAIGYEGQPLAGVPFDEQQGRIANVDGRVVDPHGGQIVVGQYVVGWARSGAQGLIGSHKAASAQVAQHMLEDLRAGQLPDRQLPPRAEIEALLRQRGVSYVTFTDWKRLDQIEIDRGLRRGAPRLKVTAVDEMLRLIHGAGEPTD